MLKQMFQKRVDLITLIAVVIFAMSITIMDFQNPGWSQNSAAYVGIIIFLVLIAIKVFAGKNE